MMRSIKPTYVAVIVVGVVVFLAAQYFMTEPTLMEKLLPSAELPHLMDDESALLRDKTMRKIQAVIKERICGRIEGCEFDKQHTPPYVSQLPKEATEIIGQLRRSTVLVVTFNYNQGHYVAPLVHQLYSRLFAEVRFCGTAPDQEEFMAGVKQFFPNEVADYLGSRYLDHEQGRAALQPTAGEGIYYCVSMALQDVRTKRPDLRVTGVLVMQEDVLLSFWELLNPKSFNMTKSFVLPWMVTYDVGSLKERCEEGKPCSIVPNPWGRSINKNYRAPANGFYQEVLRLAEAGSAAFTKCIANMEAKSGGPGRIFGGLVDLFYVAERDFDVILPLFDIAYKHQLYAEIAVPTIFHGCFADEHLGTIDMSGWIRVVDNVRKSPYEVYDSNRLMLHPFKMSAFFEKNDFKGKGVYPAKDIPQNKCLFCLLSRYSDEFFALF